MAVSVYAYKDRLAADFDQSLNRSMEEYGPNKVRSYDFDVMQETVSLRHILPLIIQCKISSFPVPMLRCKRPKRLE